MADYVLSYSGAQVEEKLGTTFESKSAVSGGTDISLVTTGEKYAWNTKAPTSSPAFSGVPTAPTATAGTSTTQIATTEFVMDVVGDIATVLASV